MAFTFPAPLTLDMVPTDLPLPAQAAKVHELCEAYIVECVTRMYPGGQVKTPLGSLFDGRAAADEATAKRIRGSLNYLATSETFMWKRIRDRFTETPLSQTARDCFRSISVHADFQTLLARAVADIHEALMEREPRLDVLPYSAPFTGEPAALCATPTIADGEDRFFHAGSYQVTVLNLVGPFFIDFGRERVKPALFEAALQVAAAATSKERSYVLEALGVCRTGATLAPSEGPAAAAAISAWKEFLDAFLSRPQYCKGETAASAFEGVLPPIKEDGWYY